MGGRYKTEKSLDVNFLLWKKNLILIRLLNFLRKFTFKFLVPGVAPKMLWFYRKEPNLNLSLHRPTHLN